MSVRFAVEGDELTIDQRRRGLRIAMGIVVVGSIAGLVIVPLVNRIPHTGRIVCKDAKCTVTYQPEDDVREVADATGARTAEDHGTLAVILDRRKGHQWVCQTPADAADAPEVRAAGEQIAGFFTRAGPATLDVTCPNHGGELNPLLLIPAVLGGNLVILLAMGMWLQEAHTKLDKHRIVMRGRSGFRKKWSLDRPKSQAVGVSLEKRYVMRGNYRHLVYVHFNDGSKVLAMAPAFYKLPTLELRTAKLRELLGV